MQPIPIEAVTHWNCVAALAEAEAKATPEQACLEIDAPQLVLKQTLDDGCSRQRRYVCPKCGIEITIDFPPNFLGS